MKKYSVLVVLFFLSISVSMAQGKFEFENTEHDFGTFEEGKAVEHSFKFKNTGNAPIIIQNVKASCGCTTPEWPRDPVKPGEEAVIKARYNSAGRPGNFHKTVTITSNAETASLQLRIKGTANRDPEKDPKIELKETAFTLGKLEKDKAVTTTIKYTNTGKTPLMVRHVRSQCNCVKRVNNQYTNIQPGETAELEISYTPNRIGDQKEVVTIYTNSVSQSRVDVTLVGEVVESLQEKSPLREGNNADGF